MSDHTAEKLAYMANQIARNLVHDGNPVAAVADHVAAFWSPRMIDQLLDRGGEGLEPIAAQAMARLGRRRVPGPQAPMTDPQQQGSDAG